VGVAFYAGDSPHPVPPHKGEGTTITFVEPAATVHPIARRPKAAADIDEAYAWYEARREGLGREFLDEVAACLSRIRSAPERHPIALRDPRIWKRRVR